MSSIQQPNNHKSNNQEGIDEKSFIPPKLTSAISILLRADPDHALAKEYILKKKQYDKNFSKFVKELPCQQKEELPNLKPLDKEELYKSFKDAYKSFRGIEFDENANKNPKHKYGEGAIFARTIIAYLLSDRSFYKSPLLNKDINEPKLSKSILVIGEMGTGKSSIMRTIYDMFLYSNTYPIKVNDIDGTSQLLKRYKLGFKLFNCHEVVQDYHACVKDKNKEHEEIFWKKHRSGLAYYDDLMTEKKAFGKDELFTEILETKYNRSCKSIASLNYIGRDEIDPITNESKHICNVETTLDAMEEKYGARMYDRIYEQFNIIELKGKSLRK